MLHELDIEGYAVVERLRVPFHPGLNVLTGETGSGKSILVGSLTLLFGGRASRGMVRAGARRARVSARFDPPRDKAAANLLAEAGIEVEDELILERQVLAAGKSRAWVNGSPVTLRMLRTLAPYLGDIHGQHEQQTLLEPGAQLQLLDSFAGCHSAVDRLGAIHGRWCAARDALERLRAGERERLHRMDLLRFQVSEIRGAAPLPGEDRELQIEQEVLANASGLRASGFEAYGDLYDSPSSASELLKSAADGLQASGTSHGPFGRLAESLEEARSVVEDVAFELRTYLEGLEDDPRRLEQVEDRISVLDRLKRKYGAGLEAVLEFAARSEGELAQLEKSDREADDLEAAAHAERERYEALAKELSARRSSAAALLAEQVGRELRDLALEKASLRFRMLEAAAPGARGVDRVALLFSANPGQPPQPLGQSASGGELSRVALALKTALREQRERWKDRRTLVFDEVDAGVSGRVAEAIGRRLRRLASASQVLCVTHLPQIACFGAAHFQVSKDDAEDRSTADVTRLPEDQRLRELARMLSGAEVSPAALENAQQLLQAAQG